MTEMRDLISIHAKKREPRTSKWIVCEFVVNTIMEMFDEGSRRRNNQTYRSERSGRPVVYVLRKHATTEPQAIELTGKDHGNQLNNSIERSEDVNHKQTKGSSRFPAGKLLALFVYDSFCGIVPLRKVGLVFCRLFVCLK